MKPNSDETLPVNAATEPQRGAHERPRTLFVHIPKSGGTTLDGIFRDHFVGTPSYREVESTPLTVVMNQLNDPKNRYVGGHYPMGLIQVESFDLKVTTLRKPLDIIASTLSYRNRLENLPPERLRPIELAGGKKQIYGTYYSPHVDIERNKLDCAYGFSLDILEYVGPCDVHELVARLATFDHVLDFDHLDDEIKSFLIEHEFFPYRDIGKKRAYAYVPDHQRAEKLLSDFDRRFYEMASRQFRAIPGDLGTRYEQYRADYCKTRGLDLQVNEGRTLDLRNPIGTGWYNVETSEKGVPFRWSEDRRATVEIPVAHAGHYVVCLYVTPSDIESFTLTASTTLGEQTFPVTELAVNGVQLFKVLVTTSSHDWIHIDIAIVKKSGASDLPSHNDVRSLGVALGHAYIVRHAASGF
jgi:hypothetical protein